jgi:hypothetical protein
LNKIASPHCLTKALGYIDDQLSLQQRFITDGMGSKVQLHDSNPETEHVRLGVKVRHSTMSASCLLHTD